MELVTEKKGAIFIVRAKGRLDASWTDFFTEAFLEFIRQGEHDLLIDAEGISFLSSAGIRSLVRIHKDLTKLKGRFRIVNANEFVVNTLQMTGFGVWIKKKAEADLVAIHVADAGGDLPADCFLIEKNAEMKLSIVNHWAPWEKADGEKLKTIDYQSDTFSMGVGCPQGSDSENQTMVGDFMVVAGNILFQSPEEESRPDFLQPLENFVPKFRVLQAVEAKGNISHLIRFKPNAETQNFSVSALIEKCHNLLQSDNILFVILAESDGMVGAQLIQSPTFISDSISVEGIGLREWLSFTGERAFVGDQVLAVGVASLKPNQPLEPLLRQTSKDEAWFSHIHAAVFPYQPIQNGLLDLQTQLSRFLNGPPPKALMHLINDQRPEAGLGQTRFSRGAVWCSAIKMEETL